MAGLGEVLGRNGEAIPRRNLPKTRRPLRTTCGLDVRQFGKICDWARAGHGERGTLALVEHANGGF